MFKEKLIKQVTNEIEEPNVKDLVNKFSVSERELGEKFKEHSVRNVTVLAAISAPEAYDTLEKIYDKVNINEIQNCEFIGDMKLNNIKTGKQNHSSKWPCPYGACTKIVMPKRKNYIQSKEDIEKEGEWIQGKDLTFQDLDNNHYNWKNDSCD